MYIYRLKTLQKTFSHHTFCNHATSDKHRELFPLHVQCHVFCLISTNQSRMLHTCTYTHILLLHMYTIYIYTYILCTHNVMYCKQYFLLHACTCAFVYIMLIILNQIFLYMYVLYSQKIIFFFFWCIGMCQSVIIIVYKKIMNYCVCLCIDPPHYSVFT